MELLEIEHSSDDQGSVKKTEGSGTKRGRGRPLSSATRLTRKKANEIAESDDAPLMVMMGNMIFYHHHAMDLTEKFKELISKPIEENNVEAIEEANKLIRALLTAREQSQRCAVDLAPYVHPRLQAIAIKHVQERAAAAIASGMTIQQASEAYAETVGR